MASNDNFLTVYDLQQFDKDSRAILFCIGKSYEKYKEILL